MKNFGMFVQKYQALRPKKVQFFFKLNFQNRKFIRQPIGKTVYQYSKNSSPKCSDKYNNIPQHE